MRILFVVPYMPTPLRVRSYNFIRHLSLRGHAVTVLAPWTTEDERSAADLLRADCEAVLVRRVSKARSALNCMAALALNVPLQAVYSWSPQLADDGLALMGDADGGAAFDVIHVEHLRGARYGIHLMGNRGNGRWGVPVVWDSVDCISHLFDQASAQSSSLFSRGWTRFELPRTRAFEAYLMRQFDRVLFTSRNDLQEMHKLLTDGHKPAPSEVVSNGVGLSEFAPPAQPGTRDDHSLIVSGKMSYHANQTMVRHLVEDIMPMIWANRPDVRLWVVGADPPPDMRRWGDDPKIEVTGTVPHLAPFLQRATVALVPLVYGTGVQNKVLEAMACATPVVATAAATVNLGAVPDKELLVAEDAEGFARQVQRLLDEPACRQEIGMAGRKYVEANHRWSDAAQRLEEVYLAARDARD